MGQFEILADRCCLRHPADDARTLEQCAGAVAIAASERPARSPDLLHDHCDEEVVSRRECCNFETAKGGQTYDPPLPDLQLALLQQCTRL